MKQKYLAVLGLFLCLSIAPGVRANGVFTGGTPTNLVPLETKEVRMVSEDILIQYSGQDWEVTADYIFENLSGREVRGRIGFPEYACEGAEEERQAGYDPMCDPAPLKYKEMTTTVAGIQVEQTKGTVTKEHPWAPDLGTVWLFDARFPPRKQIKITHHYRVRQGGDSLGWEMGTYVTRTGALWAGTIGHARFRVRIPMKAVVIDGGAADLRLKRTTHVVTVNGERWGEIRYEASNWEPTGDLSFSFNPDFNTEDTREIVWLVYEAKRTRPPAEQCPIILHLYNALRPGPGSPLQSRMLPPKDDPERTLPSSQEIDALMALGVGNLQLCRNFVYALHGRRFEDDSVNRIFYGPEGARPDGWFNSDYLTPNLDYSDALLTSSDKAVLRTIDLIEQRLAPCEPRSCEKVTQTVTHESSSAKSSNADSPLPGPQARSPKLIEAPAPQAPGGRDTTRGGVLTDLLPLKTKGVRMVSSDILIKATGFFWEVDANYVLQNLGARDVKSRVGIPTYSCDHAVQAGPGVCELPYRENRGFRTTVDGVELPHYGAEWANSASLNSEAAWWADGSIVDFEVRFAAHKKVKISHHYRVPMGGKSDRTTWGQYVARTGGLWDGSIGRARLRIHFPAEALSADAETSDTGLRLTKRVIQLNGAPAGELLLEATNWEPTRDLLFSYNAQGPFPQWETVKDFVEKNHEEDFREEPWVERGQPLPDPCPNILAYRNAVTPKQGDKAIPLEWSAEKIEDLVVRGVGDLASCRNLVYAAYGLRFEDEVLNRYYYGPSGFSLNAPPHYGFLEPNPNYSDRLISDTDKAVFRLIDAVEERLARCAPCESAGETPASAGDKTQPGGGTSPRIESKHPLIGGCHCGATPGRGGSWSFFSLIGVIAACFLRGRRPFR